MHPGDREPGGAGGSGISHHRDHAGLPRTQQLQWGVGGGQCPELCPCLPAGPHLQGTSEDGDAFKVIVVVVVIVMLMVVEVTLLVVVICAECLRRLMPSM